MGLGWGERAYKILAGKRETSRENPVQKTHKEIGG